MNYQFFAVVLAYSNEFPPIVYQHNEGSSGT